MKTKKPTSSNCGYHDQYDGFVDVLVGIGFKSNKSKVLIQRKNPFSLCPNRTRNYHYVQCMGKFDKI